jgi:HSP20 family protein
MSPQTAIAMQPTKAPESIRQSAIGDAFDQIQNTYDAIARRAFEIFDNDGRWLGNDLENWLQAESELLQPVRLDITESDDNLSVRAEVPGFNAKELEINVESSTLTITGKHTTREENKKGKTVYSERSAQEILRVVDLPAEVDGSKVSAILKDGVLNIELPKAAHAKRIRIEPKAV